MGNIGVSELYQVRDMQAYWEQECDTFCGAFNEVFGNGDAGVAYDKYEAINVLMEVD